MQSLPALIVASLLAGCAMAADTRPPVSDLLHDATRGRDIPLEVHRPLADRCPARGCPVVFISPGYGLPHTHYGFLARRLAEAGYLVVAIAHDLPGDAPMPRGGDLVTVRTPYWERGARTLRFVRGSLAARHPDCDWSRLVLVGHSNGGDLSAYALRQTPTLAATLVTLDHRRVPLPRAPGLRVLSLRGSDFEADAGVLPDAEAAAALGWCIVEIPRSRHDEMHDGGPAWLQDEIADAALTFLTGRGCPAVGR